MFGHNRDHHDHDSHHDGQHDHDHDSHDPLPERFATDVPAQVAGMLSAVGCVVLLGGIVAGMTTLGYRWGVEAGREDLTLGGLIVGGIVLLFAFFVGGWSAGRMTRFNGSGTGLMSAVWFLFVLALVAAVGAWIDESYNFLDEARLPDWFDPDEQTIAAWVSSIGLAILGLGAAMIGGRIGKRYHLRADVALHHGDDDADREAIDLRDEDDTRVRRVDDRDDRDDRVGEPATTTS
jgi:hypothetical protein